MDIRIRLETTDVTVFIVFWGICISPHIMKPTVPSSPKMVINNTG